MRAGARCFIEEILKIFLVYVTILRNEIRDFFNALVKYILLVTVKNSEILNTFSLYSKNDTVLKSKELM